MSRPARVVAFLTAVATTASTTAVVAQPLDPYGDETPPESKPQPAPKDDPLLDAPRPIDAAAPDATAGDRDADVDETVAAALVVRARDLIAVEAWGDAKQLLGEAVVRSPDGAAAQEAKVLLEQVNAKLGIHTPRPVEPRVDTAQTVDPYADQTQQLDAEMPTFDRPPSRAGRAFMFHAGAIGAVIGGFFGDAVTADVTEDDGDPVDTEDSGGIVGGALLGAVGGLAIGAAMRRNTWMTRDDIVVIDSFAGLGLLGSLSFAALLSPIEAEGYSVNAVLGTGAGAITGYVVAKRRDLSARRMARVDLWASAGALAPWLIFAAGEGTRDDAQVAGFLSLAGLVGGAWIGFRTTRNWDQPRTGETATSLTIRPVEGGATVGVAGAW